MLARCLCEVYMQTGVSVATAVTINRSPCNFSRSRYFKLNPVCSLPTHVCCNSGIRVFSLLVLSPTTYR
jgi:hypothetical protein